MNFVGYVFTILDNLCLYLVNIVVEILYILETNYPSIYWILLFIYSQHLSIAKGYISKIIGITIALFVIFHSTMHYILLFIVLLSSAWVKEWFLKNDWIKKEYPLIYQFVLSSLSLIITLLIFYFLNEIFFTLVYPFLLKLWNGILKMGENSGNDNNRSDSDSDKTPGKSPQEP